MDKKWLLFFGVVIGSLAYWIGYEQGYNYKLEHGIDIRSILANLQKDTNANN